MLASTAQSEHSPTAAERLALAELELARVEAACCLDGCSPGCRVRASVRQSVEAECAELERLSMAAIAA